MILEMTRAVQGGLRQEKKLEVTSNHLANASTDGFKKDVVSFDRMFRAQLTTDLTQGDIRKTGNPLDIALGDEGFFKAETANGVRYTRAGSLALDVNGVLVNLKGDAVLGQNGPITIEGGRVEINAAGELSVDGAVVDTLAVVTFADTQGLMKEGSGYFRYTGDPADEIQPASTVVVQGALEGSNVNTVTEMVNMIDHHRMYETYQKMMMTFDDIDSKAVNDVGTLQ